MAEQIERPSVTQGNIAPIKATLTRDNEAFPVADAEDVQIALVSGLGRKTVIAPEDYEISMVEEGVIYVDGPATLAPGCYGLEVKGTLNGTPWRTYTASALVVTYPTVAGGGTATATGDRIDITMSVQMYAMSMRTMEGIQQAIDEAEAAAQGAENVDAELNGTLLTVTNRQGVSQTVDTKGDTGAGVAQGGSTGQVLVKKSNTDYDTEWQNPPASGVSSVNGKSGAVTLDAEDVGALPAGTPIPDAQVQSDWNQSDNTKVDYIKNKPTIPTVPTNISSFNNDAGYITKSVDDLVSYYLKSETYTKTEVANLIAAIQQFHYEIYASTSDVTSPQGNVLYLIGPIGTGSDKYEEYVYDSTKQEPWVKIGDTSIDLSGYVTITALNTALADYTTTANLTTLLAGKQDALTFETAPSSSNKVATMADMPTTMGASGSGHKGGLVPDTPSTAGTTKFLREDGTWETPAGGAYTPTLNAAPTTSTTTYVKDGQTVNFEVGQFARVAVTGGWNMYQLYDITNGVATWEKVENIYANHEDVFITVSVGSDAPSGTTASGLVINVYYNDSPSVSTTVTTDSNGTAVLRVPNSYKYRLVFPDQQGCKHIADVVHIAAIAQRHIEVEYVAESVNSEHVMVTLKQRTVAEDVVMGSGYDVYVTTNGVTSTYSTNSRGVVEFYIPMGQTYEVSVPALEGWVTPSPVTLTASKSVRGISMMYRYVSSGVAVVDNTSQEYSLDDFLAAVQGGTKTLSDAVAIRVSTDALVQNNGVILLSIDGLAKSQYSTGYQWCNPQVLFLSIPANGNSPTATYYYDGKSASEAIQAEGIERSLQTPAVDFALGQTLSVGGVVHQGYLPSIGQWNVAWSNRAAIDDILAAVRPSDSGRLSSFTPNKWSSTQNNSWDTAWCLTSTVEAIAKSVSNVVVPFFEY